MLDLDKVNKAMEVLENALDKNKDVISTYTATEQDKQILAGLVFHFMVMQTHDISEIVIMTYIIAKAIKYDDDALETGNKILRSLEEHNDSH